MKIDKERDKYRGVGRGGNIKLGVSFIEHGRFPGP
jgi:hypothetical protein